MLINRNCFMTWILLCALTFDIVFAMNEQDHTIVNNEDDFIINIDEDNRIQTFEQFVKTENNRFENVVTIQCYSQLQKFCDSNNPNNFGCARAAIITYHNNTSHLNKLSPCIRQSVNIFFTEVIFPSIIHRDILSPNDFCNIRDVSRRPELTDDEIYLINLRDIINSPEALEKCKVDLQDFIDFQESLEIKSFINPMGKTMLEFAFFKKAMTQYADENSFGLKYLEYISKTISEVKVKNSETDTPLLYCYKFDYERMKRGTK